MIDRYEQIELNEMGIILSKII